MVQHFKASEVLRRCERWTGDAEELKNLTKIIQHCYSKDEDTSLKLLVLALLKHNPPAFYKAQFYFFLASHPAYDEDSYLIIAKSWIEKAVSQFRVLGLVPEEVEKWVQRIQNQIDEPRVEPKAEIGLSLKGLSLGGIDGTVDGAGEAADASHGHGQGAHSDHVHDVAHCKMCQRMKHVDGAELEDALENVAEERRELEEKTAQQEKEKVQKAEQAKNQNAKETKKQSQRKPAAKLPKSPRTKASTLTFNDGTGTEGIIRKAIPPGVPATSNFDAFREQYDEQEALIRSQGLDPEMAINPSLEDTEMADVEDDGYGEGDLI
ncbi:hypothetical protein LTR27_012571 [Elasticomyces elasticus]|nr:hypothetical protein LTR27_012571 [Elasticomyces elasticus]